MFVNKLMILCLLVVFLFSIQGFQSQSIGDIVKDTQVDSKTRAAVIEDIGELLIGKYIFLDVAERMEVLQDLRVPPGNRLEKLSGKRHGQYSIRINDQWRICFRWKQGHAHDVEITDYH